MTAIALTEIQRERAIAASSTIGAAIRELRVGARCTKKALCVEVGMHETTLGQLERGQQPNVKLGNAMKVLCYFGMTLAVVPRDGDGIEQHVGVLLDRVLRLHGGYAAICHHLQRRGHAIASGDLS